MVFTVPVSTASKILEHIVPGKAGKGKGVGLVGHCISSASFANRK